MAIIPHPSQSSRHPNPPYLWTNPTSPDNDASSAIALEATSPSAFARKSQQVKRPVGWVTCLPLQQQHLADPAIRLTSFVKCPFGGNLHHPATPAAGSGGEAPRVASPSCCVGLCLLPAPPPQRRARRCCTSACGTPSRWSVCTGPSPRG